MKAVAQGNSYTFGTIEEVFAACEAMSAELVNAQHGYSSAWCVKGETFAHRDSFKAMGFEWDSTRKVWYTCKKGSTPQYRAVVLCELLADLKDRGNNIGMQVGEWQ